MHQKSKNLILVEAYKIMLFNYILLYPLFLVLQWNVLISLYGLGWFEIFIESVSFISFFLLKQKLKYYGIKDR